MGRTLDEESIAALNEEQRLLTEILELKKKIKADQDRLNALDAERAKLHETEAWRRVIAERQD